MNFLQCYHQLNAMHTTQHPDAPPDALASQAMTVPCDFQHYQTAIKPSMIVVMPVLTSSMPVPTSLNTTSPSTPVLPVPVNNGPTLSMPPSAVDIPTLNAHVVMDPGLAVLPAIQQNQNNVAMPQPGNFPVTTSAPAATPPAQAGGVNPVVLMAGAYYLLKLFL